MNVTIEDRFNAFCEYVQTTTGRPVLKARRGMNFQPSQPYISIDLLSCQLVPKDDWHYEDSQPGEVVGNVKQVVRGLVYAVFQIKSFGGADAVQILHLSTWVMSKPQSTGLQALTKAALSLFRR